MTQPAELPSPLRILYLEDSPIDAEFVRETLSRGGFAFDMDVAPDKSTYEALLAGPPYDVILADFSLPSFDAHGALESARAALPGTPFVCVSGTIGEAATVELLRAGADDCVLKEHLARLPFAVQRAIDEKARERALRESEALYRSILSASPDNISVTDLEGRVRMASPAALAMFGYEREEEMLGHSLTEYLVPEDRERARANVARMLQGHLWGPDEYRGLLADGSSLPIEANGEFIRDADGRPTSLVFVVRDITERKQAEEALRERERAHDTLLGNLPGMAYRCANDPTWTMQFVSTGCEALTGYAADALVDNAMLSFFDLMRPDDVPAERRQTEAAIALGEPWTTIYRITTAAGETKWVRERGVAVKNDEGALVLEGFIQDVTDQHEGEARLEAAAAEWRRTFDAMRDSVAVFDGEGRLVRCNLATTMLTGRDFDELVGRPCYQVFHGTHAHHEDCPQLLARTSGRPETSLIEQDGRWLRVTFEPQIDDAGGVHGGVHVVTDVSDLKEGEQRLRDSVAMQKRITEGVIAALSRSVEIRDPYTGGHERRVSELATAMARLLGLDEESVRCVRVAGMLHDIGKIVVPAEILTKPGRLTETEFALIKGHPQAAYEILESIEFHCPIADVVLQHHERLDGSGYPAGLTRDETLPEARILAVADVVEAMISHRPYRAALPLDAAMAEIEDGSGSRYDAAACEAAIRLFREQGFAFSE